MEPRIARGAFKRLSRRELLKLSPVALMGAFAIPSLRNPLLTRGVAFSDWASGVLFRREHLATTFSDSELTPLERFPLNTYDDDDPGIDLDAWTLTVAGLVARPGEYTLEQIRSLPRITQNTRHVCVEGWDVIGQFGGTRIADFLRWVGADTMARFLAFECADDYYESLDMATALHPNSLLCYEMYGQPLERGHGAPLRLSLPAKLGYKSAKYLTQLEVTNALKPGHRGYWVDQGYSWFAGL
ncbi:MAG TPA: molybdopterin-dependent oxidoreductase [Terriglobia bacterium]|nr:molybdopterin-dependent oxidoreductase [Terriglobia bacterium]